MDALKAAPETLSNAERDQRLRDDVRQLAAQHKDSRSLTLEVCRLLFYRYGEAPNANRVYNLTRKGSLTTITEQVAAFWQGIRGQTHIQIPCPGLAEEAADKLGGFLSSLIQDIEMRLHGQLEAHREAASDEVRSARLAAEQSESQREAVKTEALRERQAFEADLLAASERLATAQQALAVERAAVVNLHEEVTVWTARNAEAQAQLRAAQDMFTQEVASLRQALANAEARSAAAEQRALKMIEEERGRSRQLAARCTQAEQQAEAQAAKAEAQSVKAEALSSQVLALTSEASMLKGRMAAWEEERARLLAEVQRLAGAAAVAQEAPRARVRRRTILDSSQS
ncbi:MAG: hypothetical protein ACOY4U_10545 [Pseudomonadota bacterium]